MAARMPAISAQIRFTKSGFVSCLVDLVSVLRNLPGGDANDAKECCTKSADPLKRKRPASLLASPTTATRPASAGEVD